MKKLIVYLTFIIAVTIINSITSYAQNYFYYSDGKKIPLTLSDQEVILKFKIGTTSSEIQTLISQETSLGEYSLFSPASFKDFYGFKLKTKTDIVQLVNRLKKNSKIEIASPVFLFNNEMKMRVSDRFVVQFQPSVSRTEVDILNALHHVEIVDTSTVSPNLYTLRVTSISDLSVLDMANLYHDSQGVIYSLPDFLADVRHWSIPNDPYFSNQYYLRNTGQGGGVIGADINVTPAWDITLGSSTITVAVIDDGGMPSEDLPSSRIVAGYDYVDTDNDPSPGGNEAHGMACAGIVAATQNNGIGISGIAPNCKIMFLRVFDSNGNGTSNANFANAIDFAWQNGADVLSNSWGGPSADNITAAFNRAMTQGRGGKGCVVVAAAGNTADRNSNYYGYVSFPATVSGVIAVGATDKSNNIQYYSPRGTGTQLSVVAPSGDKGYLNWAAGTIELRGDVWSLDIPGQPGWNPGDYGIGSPLYYIHYTWSPPGGDTYPPGNYTAHFGGTSAACPQAAGTAALLLSENSNLTQDQVKSIIQNTASDLGSTGYDTDFGYGRINAYAALKYTVEHYGGTFIQNVTVPSGDTWNLQPGVTLTFASGASLIVNGTLNAIGNSLSGITFNRSGTTGTWGGIQFNSGSNGNLQYCTIQNANNGIYLYNSSPQISYMTISNCNMGIYCDYYSSPTLRNNLIQSNSYGVWCNSGGSPNLATSSASGNVIRNNTNNSVYAIYGSNPILGVSTFGGNSFYSNGTPSVSAIYSSNINAINNWWGMYPPADPLFYTYYGTITYMPALTSNPNFSIVINNNTPTAETSSSTNLSVMGDDLGTALDKEKDKKYDEAIPLFLQVFKNNTDALIGKYALSKIEECFTQAGKKDYLDYSKKEIKPLLKEGSETYVQALELETHQMVNAGMYKDAVNNLLTILKKYNLNSYVEKNTLFTLGAFYHLFLGDEINSDKYFEELKQKYPKDELVGQIGIIKNFGVVSSGYTQNAELMPAEETDKQNTGNSSVMISNYPNPFNPTTKISFSLPQKSQIKLKVFDVLGREIQILADGIYEAGKYEVEFNATTIPSGVYFYNLTSGSNSITKKMILLR